MYQPKTGAKCSCKPGIQRDNCPQCEGTGMQVDFRAIRERNKPTTLYQELKQAGCEMDSHASDLYIKSTPDAEAILRKYPCNAKRFLSRIDGTAWWDVPFMFDPWWEARQK